MESTERAISSALRCLVPLNTMCSIKCERPFSGPTSRRDPVRTHSPREMERTCGMRSEIMRRPLGRVVVAMSRICWASSVNVTGSILSRFPTGPGVILEEMRQTIVGMELTDLQKVLDPSLPRFRARQIYEAVYRRRVSDFSGITGLPINLRKDLSSQLAMGLPQPSAEYASVDGTRRYLLELDDHRSVETV